MDRADSLVGVVTVDDAGDLDLAGGDHLDVDVVVGQCRGRRRRHRGRRIISPKAFRLSRKGGPFFIP